MQIYPENFEEKIGFDRIRMMLDESCLCQPGKKKVEEMHFSADFNWVKKQVGLCAEMKQVLELEENFPQDNYLDATPTLLKLKVEGTFPEVAEVAVLRKSLATILSLTKFLSGEERKEKYPALCKLAGDVYVWPNLIKRIDNILDKNSRVKDNASPELRDIRSLMKERQSSVSRKLQAIIGKARKDGVIADDVEVTIRNGRPVIPLPASNKRKLGGLVHDESATGKTAFVEPAAIVELNNEIKELQYAENREIIKILTEFANDIRPDLDSIFQGYLFLGEIDFLRAKARFAGRIKGVKPILENTQAFEWKKAIHPLLYLSHSKENKEVIPLDIWLKETERLLIISGPNAGGKSVCLKTVGLLQYMLQCGLLVPMSENSEVGVFSKIFIDIGDEQSLDNDLSTYSGHLTNMKHFVKFSDDKTLMLIDEFGTGTEPVLGGAIAEAVLEQLNAAKAYGVITTHYANLKHYASENEGIANGAMMFDTQKIQPLYKLEMGRPGSSFAIDIARKIGLSEEILKRASDMVGQEHIDFDRHLREINRDKKYWETKRMKIRKVERTLDSLYEKYGGELEELQKERKKILAEAKKEAQNIVKEANSKIERTIREIKESQADKEKTQKVRQDLEEFKKEFFDEGNGKDKLGQKLKEVHRAGKSLAQHSPEMNEARINKKKEDKPKEKKLEVGDRVKLKGMDSEGEIMEISGKSVVVAMGSMITTVQVDKLEYTVSKKKEPKKSKIQTSSSISNRRMGFKSEIDVRGQRAEEALATVQQFIDDAIMFSSSEVRILHGKGNGILRELIREYLRTVNVVKKYKDEHPDRGGAGITIVQFDYK